MYAEKLDEVTLEFMLAVEETMKRLALDKEHSISRKAGVDRSRIIKGTWKNFFDSLPVAIEMVHLNDRVKWKENQLKKLKNTIQWVKKGILNDQLQDIWDKVGINFNKELGLIMESASMDENAKKIHGSLIEEEEQWKQHILAILNKSNRKKKGKIFSHKERFLFQISKDGLGKMHESLKIDDKLNNKVNKLIIDADCHQIFRKELEDPDPYKFLSDELFDWNVDLIEIKNKCIWNLQDQSTETLDSLTVTLENTGSKLEKNSIGNVDFST